MRSRILFLTLVLACCLTAAVFSTGQAETGTVAAAADWPKLLKIGTASPGGNWYLAGAALAPKLEEAMPGVRVTSTTGGGVSNCLKVNEGQELQIGMAIANVQDQAYRGLKPFFDKPNPNIRFIGTIETMIWQMTVPKSSNIYTVYDLKDKRINPGKIGWGDRVTAEGVLAAHGLSFDSIQANGGQVNSLGFDDAAAMMQDGHLDCEMTYGAIMPFLLNLDTRPGLRWLPMGGQEREQFLKEDLNTGWIATTLKKGAYDGVTEDIPAVGVQTTVIVNKDLPDDMVYAMTKVLFESGFQKEIFAAAEQKGFPKAVDLQTTLNGATIPIHPGALKYFKEKGLKVQ